MCVCVFFLFYKEGESSKDSRCRTGVDMGFLPSKPPPWAIYPSPWVHLSVCFLGKGLCISIASSLLHNEPEFARQIKNTIKHHTAIELTINTPSTSHFAYCSMGHTYKTLQTVPRSHASQVLISSPQLVQPCQDQSHTCCCSFPQLFAM